VKHIWRYLELAYSSFSLSCRTALPALCPGSGTLWSRVMIDGAKAVQNLQLPDGQSGVILSVRALARRFGGLVAIDNLDLDILRGTVHALIGPNGAGKSTAVNLLSGELQPSSGTILLDGTKLTGRPPHAVAKAGIARTFQNGRLFGRLSVVENVLIGADSRHRSSLLSAVTRSPTFRTEEAQMRAEAMSFLDKLDMIADADRPVSTLSYGKQRKLEIARALILRPKVLLLDEPAAGLNSGEVDGLIDLIGELRRERLTILLIEHNMGLVMRLADRISVLNFGKKIAEGTPQEISGSEPVIEAYLGRKAAHARL
jgi:branched-chain amino acid transport system ATP-binding protein